MIVKIDKQKTVGINQYLLSTIKSSVTAFSAKIFSNFSTL